MLNSIFVLPIICLRMRIGVLDYQYYRFLCIQCQYSVSIFNLHDLFQHSITEPRGPLFVLFLDLFFIVCAYLFWAWINLIRCLAGPCSTEECRSSSPRAFEQLVRQSLGGGVCFFGWCVSLGGAVLWVVQERF